MWSDLTLRTNKMSEREPMGAELHKNLIARESILFTDNHALQAALYLDPRFRRIFSHIKPNYFSDSMAQQHLFQIFKNLKEVEPVHLLRVPPSIDPPITLSEHDNRGDNLLENYLHKLFEDVDATNSIDITDTDDNVTSSLTYQYDDKQPLHTDVLSYWYNKRFSHPLLYKLAGIVLGTPARYSPCISIYYQ